MRMLLKAIGYTITFLTLLALGLYLLGPYEESDLTAQFDEGLLDDGVARYLQSVEAAFDDITPGVQKRVIWAGAPEARTPWAVVYLHGFSATSEEIRPVPDQVAEALGANLVYTRLKGHGRGGDALAEASLSDWMSDTAEALAIGREIGDRVLVLSVSTGGTLSAAAALDEELSRDVAGMVLMSPNFGINNPLAPLLTWPAARIWLPPLAGAERSWEPHNEAQGKYWTTRYPSVAGLTVAALVKEVTSRDLSQIDIPALFIYTNEDQVVVPAATAEVADRWGGPTETLQPTMGPGDDPSSHVIAGDILSPSQNEATTAAIVTWARGL
ncbi:MAG: alpha/beta hydrolase [Sulfitobacter sp.]|nr:alpha/beta hydrolase [Sulfitobacter sp.]